jgi:transposase
MVRIQFSRRTVKSLQSHLCQAYQQGHVSRVRRISVLLEMVVHGTPVAVVHERWGISPACIYEWLKAFLLDGLASVTYRPHRGGRPAKLTRTQKKQLCQLIDAGPEAAGFETACWNSILIQTVIQREFGVAYNRYYVCELLRTLGYSFQKARFVSDHLDEARRQAWLTEEWPKILKQAKRRRAWILFGDEVSFPQWGSLSRTWARQGHQPTVKTTGKRKGYKVFGFIEYFSGQLFYQGQDGRFDSASYQAFVHHILAATGQHVFLIQDGAKYHTSRSTREFFEQHQDRITVCQLPAYSPDYNPIEYLWRKTKKQATHNKYFEHYEQLVATVNRALDHFAATPAAVLGLFGCYDDEPRLKLEHAAQLSKIKS